MNGRERMIGFLEGREIDAHPVNLLIMQYACKLSGVSYEEYCLKYHKQSEAMLHFAENYGLDCVHAAGYPWCEAMDYGLNVIYSGDLFPHPKEWLIQDVESDISKIRKLDVKNCPNMMNRVNGIRHYREVAGDKYFVYGHCEGPLAEYADLRSVEEGLCDFYDYPDEVAAALRIITDNAKEWITLQIQAGADAIDFGDAACSLISPDLYREFILPLHRELVQHIHSLGAYSKIHICGDISGILPDLISTGATIIDVDCMVDMEKFIPLLGEKQFLCGNLDPSGVFVQGTPETIREKVAKAFEVSGGKCIISGGCEIPKNTPVENYRAFVEAVREHTAF